MVQYAGARGPVHYMLDYASDEYPESSTDLFVFDFGKVGIFQSR
jgi:hypothetical protein